MSDLTVKLEKVGKVVGAVAAVVAAVAAAGGWAFSVAMTARDQEAAELREDIVSLKAQVRELSTGTSREITRVDENFDGLRVAVIALRAELGFRTQRTEPDVPVRRRDVPLAGSSTATSAVRVAGHPPPSPPTRDFASEREAAARFDEAMDNLDP
jgi:hypothetical protein